MRHRQTLHAPSPPHWIGRTCPRCHQRQAAAEQPQGLTIPKRASAVQALAPPSLRRDQFGPAGLAPPIPQQVVQVPREPTLLRWPVPIHSVCPLVLAAVDCPNRKPALLPGQEKLLAKRQAVPSRLPIEGARHRPAFHGNGRHQHGLRQAGRPSFATLARFPKWLTLPVVHPSCWLMPEALRLPQRRSTPSSFREPGCCCVLPPAPLRHRPTPRRFQTGRCGSRPLVTACAALPIALADHPEKFRSCCDRPVHTGHRKSALHSGGRIRAASDQADTSRSSPRDQSSLHADQVRAKGATRSPAVRRCVW